MALRTLVYLQSVNNLSDARYGAGMGVGLIGYPLAGEAEVTPQDYQELSGWVSGPEFVGEFGDDDPEVIRRKLELYPVDFVGTCRADIVDDLRDLKRPLVLFVSGDDLRAAGQTLAWHADRVQYFVLHCTMPPTDAERVALQRLAANYPLLLDFPGEGEGVPALLDDLRPTGLALRGGDEERPGFKDFDALADMLEALETDD
ncbi:MAG: hypothetical protein WBA12_10850 [Catalinimonas sp.]